MDTTTLERLRRTLAQLPGGCWQEHMVPAAVVIELLELTAGVCRQQGDALSAADLDDLRRNFLASRQAALQQELQELAAATVPEPEPLPEPDNPALRERWRRVPGTSGSLR
jgi:hypothetical protein